MTDLRRHVAPIALRWDEEVPGSRWRAIDGTLVFADVSGFTALTERLTRKGRIGAEEITETLNRVFGPMLRIAAARHGELLKFGGDALLFLFRGDDHPEQACDAAVEMRAALRQAAAVPTSVGRLSLSMSVGVHSGEIHLFLVGEPTREMLILGPGATRTAEAEKAAEAGQIAVSRATADRLAPDAVKPRKDGQLLLRRRFPHTAAPGAGEPPSAAPEVLRTLFPHALGEYLGSGVPDPEHRMACIAFIRVSGTDAMLAGSGPDVLAEALHRTVTLVEEGLASEAVTMLATDLDSDGGKFFLGSGIPTAFEDNEGRMLRALRRIADSRPPLPLQFGVNRGHVFAAEVGIPDRGAFSGMGDTTNTAARITAKAPAGTIYAHPAVLEHSRTRFAVDPAGPFPMKGKALPLLVYEVGEELGTREEATADAGLPFVGRGAELATVRAALGSALSGTGGVITITGAAGMGKTRLAHEAVGAVPGAPTIVVRAEPYGTASAYRVFRDPIRRLLGLQPQDPGAMGRALLEVLGRTAPDLLPMAPLIADVVAVDVAGTPEVDALDPQYRPDRLADAMVRLADAALPGPLTLIVEDAQWADGASARLLDRIAAASSGRPWAVIAIRRGEPGGFSPGGGTRVTLDPLSAAATQQLVIAATAATPLRPHEIAAIVDRAQGNPLFVEELTRVALGTGSMESLPESLNAAMAVQIDLLPPYIRRVLRQCAVLGRSFPIEFLRRTLEADHLAFEPATAAALAGFLEPDGMDRLRFRNGLIRDATYDGMAFRRRAQLHAVAGRTLERMSIDLDADSPTLALHFWRAGDMERTWRYAQQAGELARRAYSNVDAAALYERAVDASRRVPGVTDADRAALWSRIADLRELAGILDGSIEAYRKAAALSPDPVARAAIMARRARVHNRSGADGKALRAIAAARKALGAADGDTAHGVDARLSYVMSLIRLDQGRSHEARGWAERAVESARRADDGETLGMALLIIDSADYQLGRPDLGSYTREALEIAIARGDKPLESVARANLGGFAFFAGRWDEAAQWNITSSRVALEAGNDYGAAETDLNYADIMIYQGRLDEAQGILSNASRVLRASGVESFAAYSLMVQARLLVARGDIPGGERLARESVERFRAMGNDVDALEASLVLAEALVDSDRSAQALSIIDEARSAAGGEATALEARSCLARARALLALGSLDEAGLAIRAGLDAARGQGLPYEEAMLLRLRSRWRTGSPSDAAMVPAPRAAVEDEATAQRLLAALGVGT